MSTVAPMIELDGASKWFGDVVAVSDVSFSVGPGVTSLLGPNGAGKSTILRLVCGMARPSRGAVAVLGADPASDPALYSRLGLVPQQEDVLTGLRAWDFVELGARLSGVPDARARAAACLETVELDPADRRALGAYSKGMRQRAKVAAALVHDPEVLVLDEPLNGLDPRQRRHLIALFHRLADEGRCLLVSSHVLDEVERIGSRVLVLVDGHLAAEGDFRAIRELMDDRPRRVRIACDDPQSLAAGLIEAGVASGVRLVGTQLTVDTLDAASLAQTVAVVARTRQVRLHELVPLDEDLESVFRYLVETP